MYPFLNLLLVCHVLYFKYGCRDAPCYFYVFNNYLKAKQALQKKKQQLQQLAPIKMSKLLCKKPNIKPVKRLVH